jgi:imidazolonepropionase-like amidohydrolase
MILHHIPILQTAILALALTPLAAGSPGDDLLAIRVGKAETISDGTLEHAVILVENGKIVAIGEDLIIERGIPILDRPDWVVTPGLVNCFSRAGLDGRGGRSFDPQQRAAAEIYAGQDIYADLLAAGVTTLGLVPAGNGIPGQAVAVRTRGDTPGEMILADSAYLSIYLQSSQASKKMLRDGFKKADEHDEKVQKAREKWEKAQEKKKKKKKSSKSKKKDDDEDDDKKEEEEQKEDEDDKKDDTPDVFVAPVPDPKVVPFLALRAGELTAMMSIRKSADYLHLLDALGDEEIQWFLQTSLRNDIDLYEIKDRIGERELRIVLNPVMTLQPATRRERNIPAEMHAAGAKVVLTPRSDSLKSHEQWMADVGLLVAQGLDRQAALAAMTLEAANALGLGERLGSLEKGKDANLVLWDGDPFEPSTRVQAVMLEGKFVKKDEVGE